MTRELEFTLRQIAWSYGGSKGQRPEPIPLPEPPSDRRQKADASSAKARAWKRRQDRKKK